MEDDFEFPTGSNMEKDEMDIPEDDPISPILKVGEEKEIWKNGLKKKLVKEGEGWETSANDDEIEGKGSSSYSSLIDLVIGLLIFGHFSVDGFCWYWFLFFVVHYTGTVELCLMESSLNLIVFDW